MMALLAVVACSDSGTEPGGNGGGGQTPPKQPQITLNASAVDFPTEGGSREVTFNSSEAWTAQVVNNRADDWCFIEPASGAAGNAGIVITTTDNDTPDDRTASVIIKAGTASKTVKVSQKQKDALTVTSSKFEVAAEGGEVVVEVKANIDFEYVVDDAAKEWISYEGTRAIQTSTLVFKIKANDDTEKREGKIIIKSGEFKEIVNIYQAGSAPSIVISQNEYVVPSAGETIAVEVKSNVDVSIEIPQDANWIKENATRGVSTNTYYFDIDENVDYDQRSAEIKFTNKENNLSEVVKVVQVQKDAILVADSEYEFDHTGGELDSEIQTNVDFTVTISDNATDWIHQVDTRALETKTLHFNISANSSEDDREGTITISGDGVTQTIKIKQIGIGDLLEVNKVALIALYNATNGGNWINNDNWCSDKPITEWYGIRLNGSDFILDLSHNNLLGILPNEIGNLTMFKEIYLHGNNLQGTIPPSIGNLANLELLIITGVFSGALPSEIGNLSKLGHLHVEGLIGNIPNEIGELHDLEFLQLDNCNFDGGIPTTIGKLQNLKELSICHSNLSGEIPKELGNISKLEWLGLTFNQLTGGIPKELSSLQNLNYIDIRENRLAGRIPSEILEWPMFQERWGFIIPQQDGYGFSLDGLEIYAPQFSMSSLSGKTVSNSIFAENDYTVLYHFHDGCAFSSQFTPKLIELYEGYKNLGLGVFSATWQRSNIVQAYANSHNIPWEILIEPENLSWDKGTFANYYVQTPFVAVFDTTGRVVFNSALRDYCELPVFLNEALGAPDDVIHNYYESTDYSKDGVVETLQTASKGDGVDIVLMGDAYSDRLIADGTYDNAMNTAMEKFFAVEPYKSFRDYFNVYSVTAVSQNEVYSDATSTVFEGYFGEGTHVGGDDEKVFTYAQKAISADRIDDALIVVMMNSPTYAGTCYMYGPSEGDWGDGASVSYFPVGVNDVALAQVLHHEAGGHGFAKLGDEYAYESQGAIPGSEISDAQNLATYGWWKNVDFTNDPTQVKWYHFLTDSRYSNEGLGIYEGAFTYWTGAYRPTENSIMNTNVGGFNAPSREAIYYRIHKLAYGADWEYDYEEFVEWDAKNRSTSSSTRGIPYRPTATADFKPTHPPVVINKTWREAMNQ